MVVERASAARRDECVSKRAPARAGGPRPGSSSYLAGNGRPRQAGFSLIELLIVCAIISIAVGLALSRFSGRDVAGRLASDVAQRVRQRRASAIRINALTSPTLLENFRQPSITIDFSNPPTTAALLVEGSGSTTTFTAPASPGGTGAWNYVYQGDAITLPQGWRIARSADDLAPIPTIPLGVPVTSLSFTASGGLDPSSLPPSASNTDPNVESPFPAIYLTNGVEARAVAVHPSGLVEIWRYDESAQSGYTGPNGQHDYTYSASTWFGYGNRTVTDSSTSISTEP